jgi:hypothetical protein
MRHVRLVAGIIGAFIIIMGCVGLASSLVVAGLEIMAR